MSDADSGSSIPKKKVLIVDASQENNALLVDWFKTQPDFHLLGVFQSPQIALKEGKDFAPDLVLAGIDIPNGVKFCRNLRRRDPSVCIIALVRQESSANQLSIRQSGALESLIRGADPDLIGQTIRQVATNERSPLCSIIGVGGIKEGVGTTLLTCILGDFLGKFLPEAILLMDLDFRRGDLAFALGQPAKKHVQELVAMENFLYFENLQKFITPTLRGFSLLPSAQDPELKILSDIAFVGLLTALGNFYEVILIDLPPYPFQGLSEVIDICDTVIINVGETPNQMKSMWWLKNSDWKKLSASFREKLLFVSWRQEAKEKTEVEAVAPRCTFLPKPGKAPFSDPAFSIHESAAFEPLREALGMLCEKIPGLSLYSMLKDSSEKAANGDDSKASLFSRFFQFFLGN